MFICSFKVNKTGLLSVVAAICLALTLVFLMLPENSEMAGVQTVTAAGDETEMISYLDSLGFTAVPKAILIEDVTIPQEFDDKYNEYNKMQTEAGFNLEAYQGKGAKKYTFKLLNYPAENTEVVANLLVLDGKIIGGDISETVLGGFSKPLIKMSSDKKE